MSHLNRWSAVHGTYSIKQLSSFGANSYVISLKYLYRNFSFRFNIKSTPVLITILTGVPLVLWTVLWMQLGQRYGRQTIGHNSNINNRHTALYIYSATGPEVRQTIGQYSNCSNRLSELYMYRAAWQFVSAVRFLWAAYRDEIQGCINCTYNNLQFQYGTLEL